MKGGDASIMYDISREGVNTMLQEILFRQIEKEQKKLDKTSDILISLCRKYRTGQIDFYDGSVVAALTVQYDELSDSISNLYVAVLECGNNKSLLIETIQLLNDLSLKIACFVLKVFETEEVM